MIRLRRVAREQAIKDAIRKLNSRGAHMMHTKGEICRVMGIKSTSKIRIILDGLVESGELVGATTALDGYAHEISIYGLPHYEQMVLPDHSIQINGVKMEMKHSGDWQ